MILLVVETLNELEEHHDHDFVRMAAGTSHQSHNSRNIRIVLHFFCTFLGKNET